jgi:hypothetical protein
MAYERLVSRSVCEDSVVGIDDAIKVRLYVCRRRRKERRSHAVTTAGFDSMTAVCFVKTEFERQVALGSGRNVRAEVARSVWSQ